MKYTAEEVRARLGFVISDQEPRILTWESGGCHPASIAECALWDAYIECIKADEGAAPRVTERLVQAVHLYRGDCPDALQPESRDTECEACREEDALRAHLLSQEAEISNLRDDRDSWLDQASQRLEDWDDMRRRAESAESRLAAADALLREISDRTATGTDFRDLAVRIRAHLSENADVQP